MTFDTVIFGYEEDQIFRPVVKALRDDWPEEENKKSEDQETVFVLQIRWERTSLHETEFACLEIESLRSLNFLISLVREDISSLPKLCHV